VAVVDLNALHRELHRALTTPKVSGLDRGLTLSRNLAALDPDDAATLATHLVHNLSERQLFDVGRGGLNALRRAVATDQAERREHALERVDAARKELPPVLAVESDGMWVLSAIPPPSPVTRALPELSETPQGTVVILVSLAERICLKAPSVKTAKARLCEHYRQCHDELPGECSYALEKGQVLLLPIERVSTGLRSLWVRLRAFVVRAPAWA
jgi:hypothetical protein